MKEIEKYNIVYKDSAYRSLIASQGMKYVAKLCADLKFKSVLDVGCGPGWSLIELLGRGYKVQGIESCKYLFDQELRVPAGLGMVKEGVITGIPFPEDSFDLVFCTDVLEHIPEEDIHQALYELFRVTKKYVYMTICSQEAYCFPELKLHCTVKPRQWWEEQIEQFKVKKIKYGGDNEYLYIRM